MITDKKTFNEIIHWSDWSSQPSVRIACTQELHSPWAIRKDVPPNVHEIPDGNIFYTFTEELVTCPNCLDLETYKKALALHKKYLQGYYNRISARWEINK